MGRFVEYESFDASGLSELVRRNEITPGELVDAAIERIELRNPYLNAVVCRMFDDARKRAKGGIPEGPFKGVPFLLKDLTSSYAGVPLTSGSRIYSEYRPGHHSEMVRRLLASGVIVLGKTNTPEFGLLPVTEPELFGPARNPWKLHLTPGGSSGGSAAAVAARMVPMAGGGDGGGSIRIPASCCGLFGLKPSRGLSPTGPDSGEYWQGFAVEHVLTVSVRDSAAMLDATSGPEPGAYHHALFPRTPFLDQAAGPPGKLRIAYSPDPYLPSVKVHPDCEAALEDSVGLLSRLGHEMIEARPALDGEGFAEAFLTIVMGEVWAEVQTAEKLAGREAKGRDLEDATWLLRALGTSYTAGEYAEACRRIKRTGYEVSRFMQEQRVDLLLSPTLASPPIPVGTLLPRGTEALFQRILSRFAPGRMIRALGILKHAARRAFDFVPYTPLFNATGQPSMSVPLYWNKDEIPIGVMFSARYGEDGTLLRLGAQLEQACPWKERKPPLCDGRASYR